MQLRLTGGWPSKSLLLFCHLGYCSSFFGSFLSRFPFWFNWKVWKLIRLLIIFHNEILSDIFISFLYLAISVCYLYFFLLPTFPNFIILLLQNASPLLKVRFFSFSFLFWKKNCLNSTKSIVAQFTEIWWDLLHWF